MTRIIFDKIPTIWVKAIQIEWDLLKVTLKQSPDIKGYSDLVKVGSNKPGLKKARKASQFSKR